MRATYSANMLRAVNLSLSNREKNKKKKRPNQDGIMRLYDKRVTNLYLSNTGVITVWKNWRRNVLVGVLRRVNSPSGSWRRNRWRRCIFVLDVTVLVVFMIASFPYRNSV